MTVGEPGLRLAEKRALRSLTCGFAFAARPAYCSPRRPAGRDGFSPNPAALWGPHMPVGTDHAAYYSTAPLRETLQQLVDFEYLCQAARA